MKGLITRIVILSALISVGTADDTTLLNLKARQLICSVNTYLCVNVCIPNKAMCTVPPVTVTPPVATVTAFVPV